MRRRHLQHHRLAEECERREGQTEGRPEHADASKRGRPVMGSAIILPMKADSVDRWSGQVYNAEDGKTYNGSFALSAANKAELKGCVAIICKTKTWTRIN
jgi:uncharacterized protein (DUF2147 family)